MENRENVPGSMWTNYLVVIQYIIYGSAVLYFGRDIFVPLSFAALISFVLYPVVDSEVIFGLSIHSPLYKVMKGKKAGEAFSYKQTTYLIEEIF